jgi:hypothetical protein
LLAFCDIEESTALLALALINVFPVFAMILGMMSASTIYRQNAKSQEIAHQATYDWSPMLTQKILKAMPEVRPHRSRVHPEAPHQALQLKPMPH